MIQFKSFLSSLEEQKYLAEIFDNPTPITRNEFLSNYLQTAHDELHKEKPGYPKHTDCHVYDIGDTGGHFQVSTVNGAVEVHHIPKDMKIGKTKKGPANLAWAGAAHSLIEKHGISQGKDVRIIGSDDLVKPYRFFSKHLAKKHKLGWSEHTYQDGKDTKTAFELRHTGGHMHEDILSIFMAEHKNEGYIHPRIMEIYK